MGQLLYWPGDRRLYPDILATERRNLEAAYPTLRLFERGEKAFVYGTYRAAYEIYEILIFLPLAYPDQHPILFPLGYHPPRGPIPRTPDRHINSDGTACVGFWGDIREYWPQGSTLTDYIERLVHSYLVGLTSFEAGEGWPWGERGHGIEGAYEWVLEKLGTTDRVFAEKVVEVATSGTLLDRDSPCLCGSNRKMRKCHFAAIEATLSLLVGTK